MRSRKAQRAKTKKIACDENLIVRLQSTYCSNANCVEDTVFQGFEDRMRFVSMLVNFDWLNDVFHTVKFSTHSTVGLV